MIVLRVSVNEEKAVGRQVWEDGYLSRTMGNRTTYKKNEKHIKIIEKSGKGLRSLILPARRCPAACRREFQTKDLGCGEASISRFGKG